MMDLIYAGKEEFDLIKEEFPYVIYKEEIDSVHLERFSVDIIDKDRDRYVEYLIKHGLGAVSITVQLQLSDPSEWFINLLKKMESELEKKGR